MSGFEVAGIVLGSLPLLITALEAYSKFLRGQKNAVWELKSMKLQLTTEETRLRNICELLIQDTAPQKDKRSMLLNPFGPLWQVPETNDRIQKKLGDAYKTFQEIVLTIQKALESIMKRLEVHVSRDGEVIWMKSSRMTREFKAVLYRIHRDDYKADIVTIRDGIGSLESLATSGKELQPSRMKDSRGRVFEVLRELSISMYRALCSSIRCTDSHDVSLELTPQLIETGSECDDEKVLRQAQFRLAISFEMVEASTTRRFWDEVNIKTARPITRRPPAVAKPSQPQGQTKNFGRFADKIKKKLSSPAKPSYNIKLAIATSSRPATNTAFIETGHSEENQTLSWQDFDLCMTLRNARTARPQCYGHLVDKRTGYADRHFQVCPLGNTANSDGWSIVTLNDILEGKGGHRPLVSLAEKVRLALAVASSVLQLSKTPWLPEVVTRKNVHFFRKDGHLSFRYPFLLRDSQKRNLPPPNIATATPQGCPPLRNPTMLALGILLLEIILGQSFEQLRSPDEMVIDGDLDGSIRAHAAAHKLLERVATISTAYQAVVQNCIDCEDTRGLEEEEFGQEVCSRVVMVLEAILESTKLGM